MNWLKNFFYKIFGKSERKIFDKSDLEYKDSDNTQKESEVSAGYPRYISSG